MDTIKLEDKNISRTCFDINFNKIIFNIPPNENKSKN